MSGASAIFLGTGEAFDRDLPNTSILLTSAGGTRLLLDCGALVPPRLWTELPDGSGPEGIWVSHLHADHAFGLPLVLGRLWEEGRTAPLAILGAPGVRERVLEIFELGYPGMPGRLRFAIEEVAVEPGREVRWRDLVLRSAPTTHPQPDLAVRIALPGGSALTYSGDGGPTDASAALGEGAHWVHECYAASRAPAGHADLARLADEARARRPARLGLVHLGRSARDEIARGARTLAEQGVPVEVPRPGDRWDL